MPRKVQGPLLRSQTFMSFHHHSVLNQKPTGASEPPPLKLSLPSGCRSVPVSASPPETAAPFYCSQQMLGSYNSFFFSCDPQPTHKSILFLKIYLSTTQHPVHSLRLQSTSTIPRHRTLTMPLLLTWAQTPSFPPHM